MSERLSVIVPVRDGARYLAAAVASVLAGGHRPLDILVVDEGTTDGSLAITRALGDPVRRVTLDAGPGGAPRSSAAALNLGIRQARGDLLAFLDADDLWTPEAPAGLLGPLLADPAVGIVQGHLLAVRDRAEGRPGSVEPIPARGPYLHLNLGAVAVRRRVFDEVGGFDESLPGWADYDWLLRAWEQRVPKRVVPEVTLLCRLDPRRLVGDRSRRAAGLAGAHRNAIARRRAGRLAGPPPPGFPPLHEYVPLGEGGDESAPDGGQPAASPAGPASAAPAPLERLDRHPLGMPADTVLALMVVRDEAARLPFALAYHRRLGVGRFLVVDNASTDETRPFLLAQPDVHVWRAAGSFRAARCGTDWIEALLREHGVGRWCLVLDADELFCYADCESRPVPELCATLAASGRDGVGAVLVDMYSDRPVRETRYRDGEDPREVCPFFDAAVYDLATDRFPGHEGRPSYFGGVRRRVFGGSTPEVSDAYFYCLNKVPLLRYHPRLVLSDNLHWVAGLTLAPAGAALLHPKYVATFAARAVEEARRGEHWSHAIQYVRYAEALGRDPDLTLFDPARSVRFRDSRQLVELGLIRDLWQDPGPDRALGRTRGTPTLTRQLRDLLRAHRTGGGAGPREAGVAALREGRLEAAVAAFEHVIRLNPDLPWAHHDLGEALGRLGRHAAAAAAYRRAIALNPHFAPSHAGLGDALAGSMERDEAARAYRRALELQPDLAAAARGLARLMLGEGRDRQAEAVRWLRRAHALDPGDPGVYAEALTLRPVDPDLCVALAGALAARGDTAQAILFYQLALAVRPEDPSTLIALAALLVARHEPDGARSCLRAAAGQEPDDPDLLGRIAEIRAALGQTEEAIDAYRRAVDRHPAPGGLLVALGDLLARQGRVEEASQAYRRAVEAGYRRY